MQSVAAPPMQSVAPAVQPTVVPAAPVVVLVPTAPLAPEQPVKAPKPSTGVHLHDGFYMRLGVGIAGASMAGTVSSGVAAAASEGML